MTIEPPVQPPVPVVMLHPYQPDSWHKPTTQRGRGWGQFAIWVTVPILAFNIYFCNVLSNIDFKEDAYALLNYLPLLAIFVIFCCVPFFGLLSAIIGNLVALTRKTSKISKTAIVGLVISVASIISVFTVFGLLESSAYKIDYLTYLEPYLSPYLDPIVEPLWQKYLEPYIGIYPYS